MSPEIRYLPHIDGLRALAVLSVLIYHVDSTLLPGGFLGVDIFFVISGYLISLIVFREQSAGTFSFRSFYARRIRRLFPALTAVLLATMLFGAFAMFADEYERLSEHAVSAIVFLLNFRLTDEAGYFDVASHAKPLLHLWSLSVEEQFYLVWPVLIVLVARLRLRAAWVTAVLATGSFAFAIDLAGRDLDALYFHPLARFWELLAGAALAWVHHFLGVHAFPARLDNPKAHNLLSLAGLAAIAWSFLFWNASFTHPGGFTVVPLLGVVALIASGSHAAGNRVLALRPLVWMGLISYPLYLWHWPVLSYIRIAESGAPGLALLWGGAALSVVLAALTYRWVEQPLRTPTSRPKLVALIGSMVGLLVASRAIAISNGLPDRPALEYIKIAEAQMAREPRQDASCTARFQAGDAPVYCRQNKAGERMIAIVGDSHAHVLFPGVAALAGDRGYGTLLLANSGCPPFEGAVTGRNAKERDACAESIERILSEVERDRRVIAVIVASRGPQYISGLGFGPAEANYSYPPIAARRETADGSDTDPGQVFQRGLRASLARIHKHGLPVAYLLQVPELGVPARDCLRRPMTLSDRNAGCRVPYEIYRERMRDYRSLVAALERSLDFLRVVDVEGVFCQQGICSGIQDGELLYADDNHLSVLGSMQVAPSILSAFPMPSASRVSAVEFPESQ